MRCSPALRHPTGEPRRTVFPRSCSVTSALSAFQLPFLGLTAISPPLRAVPFGENESRRREKIADGLSHGAVCLEASR